MDKAHKGGQFLHNHPGTEKRLGLDEGHVIIDRADWEEAKLQLARNSFRNFAEIFGDMEPPTSKEEIEKFLFEDVFPEKKKEYIVGVDPINDMIDAHSLAVIQVMKDNRLDPNEYLMIPRDLIVPEPVNFIAHKDDEP